MNKTNETGRTALEILVVLSIITLLSLTGIWGYNVAIRKKFVNDLLYAVNMTSTEIRTNMPTKKFTSISEMDKFLKEHSTVVRDYIISYGLSSDSTTENNFTLMITKKDQTQMKYDECITILSAIVENNAVIGMNFDFSEEQSKGVTSTVVNLKSLCKNLID